MQYGILKDGTFVITENIENINNVDKTFKTEKAFKDAGGIIPFTMMNAQEQKEYMAKQAGAK